jgi:hypothetical protein
MVKRMDPGRWGLVACLGIMLVGYAWTRPAYDFVEYWSSAQELMAGRNPYSLEGTLRVEKALGWPQSYSWTMMNPPWALPFVAPLGLFHSYRLAYFLWASMLAVLICLAMAAALKLYSPDRPVFPSESFLSQGLVACTFVPAILSVGFGQVNSLLLVGLAGFLWFENKQRYALAGACLAIASVKPQILFLVWLALVLESLRKRRWQTIAGSAAGVLALAAIALTMRPRVFFEYSQFARSGYGSRFFPALGGMIRLATGNHNFLIQFLAPAAGLVWFGFYWRRHRDNWNWLERIPVLVTVSVLTTAYGWMLDQVILLIPIAAIAAHYRNAEGEIPRRAIVGYTIAGVAIVAALFAPSKIPLSFPIAPLAVLWSLSGLEAENPEKAIPALDNPLCKI